MPITIHPPDNLPPERILLFGKEGTGKTRAVLSVAQRIPSAHFHVIDTDYSASYDHLMHTEFPTVGEVGNMTTYVTGPWNWTDIAAAAREAQAKMRRGDWLVVDSMTPCWKAVQEHFVQEVHGSNIEAYLLDVRRKREEAAKKGGKRGSSLEAFDGWMDWSVINPMYSKLHRCILDQPGHLIITAEGQALGDNDSKAMRDQYQAVQMRPAGQKQLGFITRTVLAVKKGRKDDYTLTTVKDRGREDVEDMELDDFAKQYLQGVAGWKPRPWKGEEG